MQLQKQHITQIVPSEYLSVPDIELFELPEKVLQFGTGVLLRALPNYFIDKANRQGIFNGRIVVVKSTSQGGTDAFTAQDNLYTQCIKGIEDGNRVDAAIINSSISRVLAAADNWDEILACAANPQLQIIISNTTEVGIVLLNDDDIKASPPTSFPGKLLAFLLQRYMHFKGSKDSGMVIIPTELITSNGTKLKEIVTTLARQHKLDDDFISWLQTANDFCNSLVDRIVPGKLPSAEAAALQNKLGYTDDLMIMSEVYRLWAIETVSDRTKEILLFSKADKGVVIAGDIFKFRELKLRLLNGSHTFTCGLAVLAGFATVKDAMNNETFSSFITQLMMNEMVPAIVSGQVTEADAKQFAVQALDRFRNPFIEHQWLSITLQYSSKMKLRNVPVLLQYYEKRNAVPQHMALGFAAYLLFMQSQVAADNIYVGTVNNKPYKLNDDSAALLHAHWQKAGAGNIAQAVLEDEKLWGTNLSLLPGFAAAVQIQLQLLTEHGAEAAMKKLTGASE